MYSVWVKIGNKKQYYAENVQIDIADFSKNHKFYSLINNLPVSEIKQFNGVHFIFGWFECFIQSDNVPQWIWETDKNELFISVEED